MDGNSALLASYDDDLSVSFWAGLRKKTVGTKLYHPSGHPDSNRAGGESWAAHAAPDAMVEEAHRQVVRMHGVSYAPMPYAAAYRDWAEDPYGGGVNFWQIHAKSWEVIQNIFEESWPRKISECFSPVSVYRLCCGSRNQAHVEIPRAFQCKMFSASH